MKLSNNSMNYIVFFIILIGLSMFYNKLKVKEDINTTDYYYKMVNQYLVTDNYLGANNKPLLWIHLHNDDSIIPEVNARHWLSFKSRNTKDFNQPYQYLTIKSIINNCGADFNILLIDDESFKKILPKWSLDLRTIANPIRNHLRLLAMSSVLNIYGGMLVPSSFICFKSLKTIYDSNINENKMFVGEFINKSSEGSLVSQSMLASHKFMGCSAKNEQMHEFIRYLESLNSTDFTAESDFLKKTNYWLNNAVNEQKINNINGQFIGTKKLCNTPILPEELLGSTFIELHPDAYGLYIPWDDLIQRTALQWFVRMSPEQVLESNTAVGKYLLINSP